MGSVPLAMLSQARGPLQPSLPWSPSVHGSVAEAGPHVLWWQLCPHPVGAQQILICPKGFTAGEHLVQTGLLGMHDPPQVTAIRWTRSLSDPR